jgi:Rod binding domain-containing protein
MQVSALNAPLSPPKTDAQLWEAAKDLEAVFLAEMLKTAGFGKPLEGFGGGIGEEQFSSVLVDHQARAFADRGGVGLAERIFDAMSGRAK